MTVHLCAPKPQNRFTSKTTCPSCNRPTLMIGISYEYYGVDVTCIRCGRNWKGGEWMPLDFFRHARRDNIRRAKRAYRDAA